MDVINRNNYLVFKMKRKDMNIRIILSIFTLFLFSCASTNYTPVENTVYKSPCFDFTFPEGNWTEISQSKIIDGKNDCLQEPTIFVDTGNKIDYSIILEFVSTGFRSINKEKIFNQLIDVFENKSNKYGKYQYTAEEIKINDRDCFKAEFESIAPGDTEWSFEGRSIKKKLDPNKDVIHQGVAIYCLYPSSSIWKGDPYVLTMFYERQSTDLIPDPEFINQATNFFKSVESPYLKRDAYN